jgi:hypothetical protein
VPASVAECPLGTVEGLAVNLLVDDPGDWCEAASAPLGTTKNAATMIAATTLASIGELYGSRTTR